MKYDYAAKSHVPANFYIASESVAGVNVSRVSHCNAFLGGIPYGLDKNFLHMSFFSVFAVKLNITGGTS